ncbi:MAG TPA: hypothetical protein VFP10_14150, partial [Candidatus Eisenbacteria bacterium]|nr:hypothetical protein [Candidatus Eisenbacteria bacterium]
MLVSPVPGNTTASGTALINALAGISSPSSTNRWLLKIEPGIYDLGTAKLPMRSWVDIEGSGIGVTTIRGNISSGDATIHGASDAELRMLTVENYANADGATAMRNDSASPRIYRVKFTVPGGTWGVRNLSSTPLIEECEVNVTAINGSLNAYGISYRGTLPGTRSSILRTKITVSGSSASNSGVSTRDGLFVTEIRDSQITVFGGTESRGIYAFNELTWSGTETLKVRTTDISAYSGSSASYGMDFGTGTSANIDITGSKVWGHVSSTTYGIRQDGS